MSLKKFLTSRSFFIQLGLAFATIVVLVFVLMQWLDVRTNHGDVIKVPDVSKLTEAEFAPILEDAGLEYLIIDSLEYDKRFPKKSVVMQDPKAGAEVKEGRKIYIKLNQSNHAWVKMPDLVEKTLRQAEPSLAALGLEIGKKTYKPYLGKDMVLEMWANGKKLKAGDKVAKSTVIDLVLGDGKMVFDMEMDTEDNSAVAEPATEDEE